MTEENIQPQEIQEQPISLNDVLEEKVNFFSLPKEEKSRLQEEYYSTLPEEDRSEFRANGYTPRQMFGGKDRYGNDVPWKTPEEFKKDIIEPRKKRTYTNELNYTKEELKSVKSELQSMKKMMEMQTDYSLESKEKDLQSRIEEARYNGDFDTYDRLKQEQFEFSKRKSELVAPVQPQVQEPQYTPEEQRAIEDFKYSNPEFTDHLKTNVEYREAFDDNVKIIIKNSRLKSLPPSEILAMAKRQTESLYPELTPKQKQNVFMNNQYSAQSNPTLVKKTDNTKVLFKYENLDYFSRKMVDGALHQYPGKTPQQVLDILSSNFVKK